MEQRLTFTAYLQDMYSSKFDKLAQLTDDEVKKIAKNLDALATTGKRAARSIDEIEKRIRVLSKAKKLTLDTSAIKYADKEIKALQKEKEKLEGTTPANGMFGGMGKGLAIGGGLLAAGMMAKDFITDSAKAFMNYEATVQSFKVLARSESKGTALAENLNKFQQDTILGPEVFKAAQTMMSFGFSVDDVMPKMRMLGDVSQGNTERFNALVLAFSQTKSAGKLMGQDLLQYVNAGFNPLQTMSERWKEFGFTSKKTVGDLRKEMEKGAITSAMVEKSFALATGKGGLFENMLDKVGETTFGKSKQLEGSFEALKIAVGEKLKPELNATFDILSSIVGKVRSWLEIPTEKKIADEITKIRMLQTELTSTNISEEKRKDLLIELEKINPKITDGIDKQKVQYGLLADNIDRVVAGLEEKIVLEKLKDEFGGVVSDYEALRSKHTQQTVDIRSKVYDADPDVATSTNLSDDEKAKMAITHLEAKSTMWYQQHENLRGRVASPYERQLSFLKGAVSKKNELEKQIIAMQPKYYDFLNKKDALQAGIKKNLGGETKTNPSGTDGDHTSDSTKISGGGRITHLNISINNLVGGGVNVYSTTVKEGASKIKDHVVEALLTAVNDANLAVGN
ncbi:MAG: hypothetical protein JSR11_03615 [Bacteroidetes bacterium]|nr:hypothetical protein [Bacteroidota bacterium]